MIKLPEDPNTKPERQYFDAWVHFFLWGNVLSNTILIALQLDTIVHSGVQTPLFLSLRVGYLIAFIIAGAMTIISFYTRQKNAIAWATTYIVMVAFNLLEVIALICIDYTNARLAYIINASIWIVFWLYLIRNAYNLNEIFPPKEREWRMPERILLAVFIVCMSGYFVGVIKAELDPYHNAVYTYDTKVQIAIEELCKVTKKDHYGIHRDSLVREGDTICMYGHYWRGGMSNLRPSVLATLATTERQRTLWYYAQMKGPKALRCYAFWVENGFILKTVLRDSEGAPACSFTVSPDAYLASREQGDHYRCDPKAWEEVLAGENEGTLVTKWAFYQQTRLSLDGAYLRYDLLMPDYGEIVLEKFTDEFIADGIRRTLLASDCPAWILGSIDRKDMLLHFDRRDGKTHTEIVFPCNVYSAANELFQ